MVTFQYQAIDQSGERLSGTIPARSRNEALQKLSAQGLQTLALNENDSSALESKNKGRTDSNLNKVEQENSGFSALTKIRLSGNQLIMFTDEISDLLLSGFQLEPSLKLMEGRQDIPVLAKIAGIVRTEIREGSSFARALKKASPSFDALYLNLVSAGEASGSLASLLARHTVYLTRLQELKNKLITAMIYPAFLLFAGAAVTVLFVTFLIPRLIVLIESTGSQLPTVVNWLISASGFLKIYWWAVMIGLGLSVSIVRQLLRIPTVRPHWDRVKLSIPLVGKMIKARFQVHFLRTLGNLLENGLSLVDSLRLTSGISTNLYLKAEMSSISEEVIDGASLHGSIRKRNCFASSLADYVRVSEQTGSLDKGIQKAAERSEKSLEKDIERVTAMIQPAIIAIMAGVIGFMAYVMIGVIYDTIEILRKA